MIIIKSGYLYVVQFNESDFISYLEFRCVVIGDVKTISYPYFSCSPLTCTSTGFLTKKSLGDTGSIIFLLNASSVSNGGLVSARVMPSDNTNLRIASGTKPLLRNAASVGSLGSSQLLIVPFSISGFIFLFETGIPLNSNLENSSIEGFRSPNLSSMAK